MEFREDERLEFTYLIRAKHVGEPVHLRLLRDGQVGGGNLCRETEEECKSAQLRLHVRLPVKYTRETTKTLVVAFHPRYGTTAPQAWI